MKSYIFALKCCQLSELSRLDRLVSSMFVGSKKQQIKHANTKNHAPKPKSKLKKHLSA